MKIVARIPRTTRTLCFKEKLCERYGPSILRDFSVVRTRENLTLSKLALKYGFTRSYAQQIFRKLHNESYSKFRKEKTQLRKEQKVTHRRYRKAVDYLKDKDIAAQIIMEGNRPLLQVGSLRLTVQKLSETKHCGRPYYYGHRTVHNVHLTMFGYLGGYYVIPLACLPKDKFYIPQDLSSQSKYHGFKDNCQLLRPVVGRLGDMKKIERHGLQHLL